MYSNFKKTTNEVYKVPVLDYMESPYPVAQTLNVYSRIFLCSIFFINCSVVIVTSKCDVTSS